MKNIVITLLISLIMIACSNESVELKNTVTAYNKMLTEALAKPDEHIMEYFTTNDELSRIGAYILSLETGKKIMVTELAELKFIDISVSEGGKAATVSTAERWTFYYADLKTREKVTKEETMAYGNTYHLLKERGHWVVDSIDVKEK